MMQKARPLTLGWYVFLAFNVVLFHGLATLGSQVPARQLAVSGSLILAASFLVQVVIVIRIQAAPKHSRNGRALINRRTGEVLSGNGPDHSRRNGVVTHAAR